MDNSLYIALSRQSALMQKMDVVANNIANVNTAGYRGERSLFDEYVIDAKLGDGKNTRGQLAFTHDVATVTDETQGSLSLTGRAFDMAIEGKGFFVVGTPLGDRYTRAGNFQLDPAGTLMNAQGYPVLGQGGNPVILDNVDGEVIIGESGVISINGEEAAQVDVVQFDNEQLLEKAGATLFKSDVQPVPAEGHRVVQGAVEQSNVNSVLEMNAMIAVTRSVGTANNLVGSVDELQLNAIRTLGRQSQ